MTQPFWYLPMRRRTAAQPSDLRQDAMNQLSISNQKLITMTFTLIHVEHD